MGGIPRQSFLQYGIVPLNPPTDCDGCGKNFLVPNAISCPKGGLIMARHNDAAKEWGALSDQALNPSAISYGPEINSRTVQGDRNGSGSQVAMGSQEGEAKKYGEGATGQAKVPDESRADISVQGFWKLGTTALFDMIIVNLDACSYLCQMSAKALETAEKEKKDKYLQPCLECWRSFTPMVYPTDGITRTEDISAHRRLAYLISNNLKREYSKICGFVRAQMSLVIVRSNTILLCGTRDKEAYIRQRPNLEDGEVMALIVTWQG